MELNRILQIDLKNVKEENYKNSDIVKTLKGFVALQQCYNAAMKEVRTKLEILDEEFHIQHDYNPIHHIEYRLKSPDSIYGKLRRKGLEVSTNSIKENLNDVAGVRVICNYIDDVYEVAKLLLKQDDIRLVKETDYIKNPKSNGYRSLHLVLEIPVFLSSKKEYVKVEVQIRTIAMDFWASLEHQLKYKSEDQVSYDLYKRLKKCAEDINNIDVEMQSIYEEIKSDNYIEKEERKIVAGI